MPSMLSLHASNVNDGTAQPFMVIQPVDIRVAYTVQSHPWLSANSNATYAAQVGRGDYGPGFAEMRCTACTSTEPITALESQKCTRLDPQHIGSSMESVLRGLSADTGPINRSAVFLHPRRAMRAILYGTPGDVDGTLEEIKRLRLETLNEDGCIGTDEQERLHDSLEQSELALIQLREAKQRPGQQVLRFQEPVLAYERQADGSITSDAQGS